MGKQLNGIRIKSKGVGRPTKLPTGKLKVEVLKTILKYMENGGHWSSVGAETYERHGLFACRWTLNRWCEIDEEFSHTKKIGMSLCERFYDKMGAAALSGNMRHFPQTAWICIKRNIALWRTKYSSA